MQYGVLIKWHSILRPELNATPRHPPRRGSFYKLVPIAPPVVVSTIRHGTLNALSVNSILDGIVSLYLHKFIFHRARTCNVQVRSRWIVKTVVEKNVSDTQLPGISNPLFSTYKWDLYREWKT